VCYNHAVETTPNVAKVVGQNVQRRRLGLGMRQDELAARLRDGFGLQWTRATVAAVETGRRQVRLDEVPTVCAAFLCTPADLFVGDGPVALADGVKAQLPAVRKLMAGEQDMALVDLGWKPPRMSREDANRLRQRFGVLARLADGTVTIGRVLKAKQGEAEQKAARKLGVDAEMVTVAALGLWKRSLTEHRDAIVAETAPADASPRTLQAMRGRVTRELVEELRIRIEEANGGERR
jgi:transcriptional regulator with XRE-family HTH domain